MAAGWSEVASSTQQNAPGACFSMLVIMGRAYSWAGMEARGWEEWDEVEAFQNRESDLLHAGIRKHSSLFCFCRRGKCRRILSDKLLHAQRPLPREREHVVRQPVEAPRAMQIAHRRQVVHQVNRPAPL